MTRRIALISEHASPLSCLGGADSGGQNVYVGQLARHLAQRGNMVDVFTRRDSPALPEIVDYAHNVRVIHVPAGPAQAVPKEELLPFMPAFADEVIRRSAREPYAILHANFFMSGLVACEVKRALGIPFVVTFHALGRVRRQFQGEADRFPDERFAIEDRIVAEADRIIAECPQDEEDLRRLYSADPARIVVIPCGFDPAELWPISKPLARQALSLDADERIILQLGRLVPRKGVDTAIRGVARLIRDHHLAARLLIVGGDSEQPDPRLTPEIGRLQAIADDEGIARHVTFVGSRGRSVLRYYYSAADVFVTTPWYEPFGITPLEAMACGAPVVGASVGGIKYTVRDSETGFLVPPNDPAAIGMCLARLYQEPNLLADFSRRAIERVNAHFTWKQVADAVDELYTQALAERAAPVTQPRALTGDDRLVRLDHAFADRLTTLARVRGQLGPSVLEAAELLNAGLARGNKVLLCGNGGSAADVQHFAGELVGRFQAPDRRALPALALTADTAVLTAWANDIGFEHVFARQVEAFGQPGDVLLGLSTSGRSLNLVRAFETAGQLGLTRIALVGRDGGPLAKLADAAIIVPCDDTQQIQEIQLVVIHLLCELAETAALAQSAERQPTVERHWPERAYAVASSSVQ
jgi:phosphoheptose isomerase